MLSEMLELCSSAAPSERLGWETNWSERRDSGRRRGEMGRGNLPVGGAGYELGEGEERRLLAGRRARGLVRAEVRGATAGPAATRAAIAAAALRSPIVGRSYPETRLLDVPRDWGPALHRAPPSSMHPDVDQHPVNRLMRVCHLVGPEWVSFRAGPSCYPVFAVKLFTDCSLGRSLAQRALASRRRRLREASRRPR